MSYMTSLLVSFEVYQRSDSAWQDLREICGQFVGRWESRRSLWGGPHILEMVSILHSNPDSIIHGGRRKMLSWGGTFNAITAPGNPEPVDELGALAELLKELLVADIILDITRALVLAQSEDADQASAWQVGPDDLSTTWARQDLLLGWWG